MDFWSAIARLAARRPDAAECAQCPPGLPGEDPAFSTAVTALGAKLARADGRAELSEFDAFSEVFQTGPESVGAVRRLYELARQTTHGYESYAKRLARRYRACPQLLEDVLDGLFHIAGADGAVTEVELDYLDAVSRHFGLSPLTFRRIKAAHLGHDREDPYVVLGVAADAPASEVREARRRLLAESHPDRVRARGLPDEYVEVFNAKAAAINQAFDRIRSERAALQMTPI